MPTIVHDIHQDWVKNELGAMRPTFLNQAEYDILLVRVGTSEYFVTIAHFKGLRCLFKSSLQRF